MDSYISSWCVFYLECDKGKESSSYQVHIDLVILMYEFLIFSIIFMCHPLSIQFMG